MSRADQGSFRARSPVDGVDRVVSFAALPGYPLAVSIGLGVHEATKNVRRELRENILVGASVSLVIAGLGALLLLQVRRREEAEARSRQAQKMESIGRLTGGIAHDFNNMLTVIAGNLELVLRGEREPKKVRLLENIERTVDHGARLVQHLLAFARRQHLHPAPLDVNRLVASFAEILEATRGPTILIGVELDSDVWLAMADANQVQAAILNVTLNARDAMPKGGRIAIETANVGSGDPRPQDLPPGDFVAITIRDTGTGMTGTVLAKALDPFFTTKECGRGSGLGLSQVYGMAKQSGGTVELDSAPGRGTAVRIYLPRASAQQLDQFRASVPKRSPRMTR
jgi:signal transduction histidine kinase